MLKPYTKVGHVLFPKGKDATEEKKLLALLPTLRKEAGVRRAAYCEATKVGGKSLRGARFRFLSSYSVRAAAAVTANARRRLSQRVSLNRCFAAADDVHVNAQPTEIIQVQAKLKSSGVGFRPICHPGAVYRTAHQVSCWMLEPYLALSPLQYDYVGVAAAVKTLMKAINDGHHYGVSCDITNYFGSFDDKLLPNELPVPRQVTSHFIVGRHMSVKAMGNTPCPKDILRKAQQGIPQGAASSAMVGVMMLSRLAWKALDGVVVANFADNFPIMATTELNALNAATTLRASVEALPAGPFSLRVDGVRHLSDGIVILGHYLQLFDGKLVVRPTNAHVDKFFSKAEELDDEADFRVAQYQSSQDPLQREAALEAIGRLHELASCWGAAFNACGDAASTHTDIVFNSVDGKLASLLSTHDEMKVHVLRARAINWVAYDE